MINLENDVLQDLITSLGGILEGKNANLCYLGQDYGIDYVFEIDTAQGKWIVPVEIKKQAYPRDVKQAIWAFDEYRQENKGKQNIVPLFVADLISEGAREVLKNHNIGYYELSGTLYIKHKQILIDIQRPRKRAAKSGASDLFTGAREMVVHALLHSRGEWFSGEELSRFSDTSSFTVSGVLKEFERREWLIKSSEGGRSQRRKLTNPSAVLNSWAEAFRQRKKKSFYGYLFATDAVDCAIKIDQRTRRSDTPVKWAITGALSANQASPLLTGVNVAEIIVPLGHADRFMQSTEIKRAEKGYNVVLHEWPSAGLQFIDTDNPFPCASNFIQYLSLLDGKGRNAELAEQFRRDILGM